MITLILGTENHRQGEEVLINEKEISTVVPSSRNQSVVTMRNGDRIHIMNSVENILNMIKEAEKNESRNH